MSLYQELSRVYDDLFLLNEQRVEWIVDLLNLNRDSKVLDLGCGTGELVISLARCGCLSYGIDNDRHMVDRAVNKLQQYNISGTHIAIGDLLEKYPFDSKFDAILCIGNTLPHLHTYQQVIKSLELAFDNLEQGGRILIQTVNFDNPNVKTKTFPLLTDKQGKVKFHRKYLPHETDREKVKFLTELEFTVTEEQYSEEIDLLMIPASKLKQMLIDSGFKISETYCNFTYDKWQVDCGSTVILAEV